MLNDVWSLKQENLYDNPINLLTMYSFVFKFVKLNFKIVFENTSIKSC